MATSAVDAGVTSGVGGVLGGGSIPNVFVRAAVSNAMTQGIGLATGLQQSFSWTAVAASAAGSAVGAGVTEGMGSALNGSGLDPFVQRVVSGTAAGIASGTTVALMSGGRVAVQQIAADAFGNALGESIVGEMQNPGTIPEADPLQTPDANTRIYSQPYERLADSENAQALAAMFASASEGDTSQDDLVAAGKGYSMGRNERGAVEREAGAGRGVVNPPLVGSAAHRWDAAKGLLVDAATEANIDAGILAMIANFESGFDDTARPIARSPERNTVRQFDGMKAMSTAYGYGQFTDSTWSDMLRTYGAYYGVPDYDQLSADAAAAYRRDPKLQAEMLAEFTQRNISVGRQIGGGDDVANVYALHNLGGGDGRKFLRALAVDGSVEVRDVLSSKVIENNTSLYGDGSISLQTAYQRMGDAMRLGQTYASEARRMQSERRQ